MTIQEKKQEVPQARELYPEEEASRLCNKWVETGLTSNKTVKFLINTLENLGCTPPDGFIQCLQCDRPGAGFFGMVQEEVIGKNAKSPPSNCTNLGEVLKREAEGKTRIKILPEVYLCQQYMENESMLHKTMVHELIHAIDQCRTRMDPIHNCIHIACTEIRAENLSGECGIWRELPRMEKFAGHGKECVRRRAILSVRGNPSCTDRAEQYVDAAMMRCFKDVYPFERHPNQL